MEEPSELFYVGGRFVYYLSHSSTILFCYIRFEMGPRIQGAKYMDMSDISATKENFPELNPKGLLQMLPPEVRENVDKIFLCVKLDVFSHSMYMYG